MREKCTPNGRLLGGGEQARQRGERGQVEGQVLYGEQRAWRRSHTISVHLGNGDFVFLIREGVGKLFPGGSKLLAVCHK
jgi:hypothetical protein